MKENQTNPLHFYLRQTAFGPAGLIWSIYRGEPKVLRIAISRPGVSAKKIISRFFANATAFSLPVIDSFANQLEALLNGEDIRFSLDRVRFDRCSIFQQKVLGAVCAIGRGRISTYQLIAKHLGIAGGARAVGTALAENPFPVVVPCHRIIRSDGALGGYQGGLKMKRVLLKKEGVSLSGSNRASLLYYYEYK